MRAIYYRIVSFNIILEVTKNSGVKMKIIPSLVQKTNKTLKNNAETPTGSPQQVPTDSISTTAPSNHHRNMFEAQQKLSTINFTANPIDPKLVQLKKSLTTICEEAIKKYNNHDESISHNLYTRGYIFHSFDFVEKAGDYFHNLKNPFNPQEWNSYMHTKYRTTRTGQDLRSVYTEKMQNGIEGWNEKFLEIITKEKAEGKNNLLDELLEIGEDIPAVKKLLGLKE